MCSGEHEDAYSCTNLGLDNNVCEYLRDLLGLHVWDNPGALFVDAMRDGSSRRFVQPMLSLRVKHCCQQTWPKVKVAVALQETPTWVRVFVDQSYDTWRCMLARAVPITTRPSYGTGVSHRQ